MKKMKYKTALEAINCILSTCDESTKNRIIATLFKSKSKPKGPLECATDQEARDYIVDKYKLIKVYKDYDALD